MISDVTGRTFEWDALNRCTAINNGTHRTEIAYDGFSRETMRVEKDSGIASGTMQFVWDGLRRCEARDGNNDITKLYFNHGFQTSGSNFYYTKDHLGSIRELLDSNNNVAARYDYDSHGQMVKVSGNVDSDFGYTGYFISTQYPDLAFAPFRIYNPGLGRFISRDPIAERGGLNLYGYVSNNPINRRDPLGLQSARASLTAQQDADIFYGGDMDARNADLQSKQQTMDAARDMYTDALITGPLTGPAAGLSPWSEMSAWLKAGINFVGNLFKGKCPTDAAKDTAVDAAKDAAKDKAWDMGKNAVNNLSPNK